jgi:putative oxidoreductase
MFDVPPTPFQKVSWTGLRIVTGLAYVTNGLPKLFGLLGGFGPAGGPAPLMSRFGAAGVLEVFGGVMIALGLFTRPVAFLLSGQMAVAYFWIHVGGGGLWWWYNSGERAMLYAFIFLLFSAWGAGPLSLDARLAAGKTPKS